MALSTKQISVYPVIALILCLKIMNIATMFTNFVVFVFCRGSYLRKIRKSKLFYTSWAMKSIKMSCVPCTSRIETTFINYEPS